MTPCPKCKDKGVLVVSVGANRDFKPCDRCKKYPRDPARWPLRLRVARWLVTLGQKIAPEQHEPKGPQ